MTSVSCSKLRFQVLCACTAMVLAPAPAAQDLERERRLAAEIVDTILDGEAVMLEADGVEFLAIYTEAAESPVRGGALVLHGRGFHPDWAQVAGPLRVALTEHGWHTLSLQMPVLAKDAKYYDYVPIFPAAFPRIEAGIAFLRERGISPIVIVAHSCSVHMTMAWIEGSGDGAIDGFVGIGMGATDYGQPMRKPFPLDRMSVPVLDVYGDRDYPAVQGKAPERAAAMADAGNALSGQVVIEGADHFFEGHEERLVEVVSAWLETLSP